MAKFLCLQRFSGVDTAPLLMRREEEGRAARTQVEEDGEAEAPIGVVCDV